MRQGYSQDAKREQLSINIKRGLQAAKKRGVVLGRHGKKVLSKTNKVAADDFAKKMAGLIKGVQREGFMTVRSIADELNRWEIPTFRGQGKLWHIRTVDRLLNRIGPDRLKAKPQPVKWVGGKRRILKTLKSYLPQEFGSYYEPFFGGGALYFEIHKRLGKAYLSDINRDLMTLYKVIQDDPKTLGYLLRAHAACHSEAYYYKVRANHKGLAPAEASARMLYLNRTCYNGLWRVNSKGEFNAAFGTYSAPVISDAASLKACSRALQRAKVKCMDYRKIKPKREDFVYLDPPYYSDDSRSFTGYAESGFSAKDHVQLAKFCKKLHQKGVMFMLSNSCTEFVRKLYDVPGFNLYVVKAPRMINCKTESRQAVEEYIITNY